MQYASAATNRKKTKSAKDEIVVCEPITFDLMCDLKAKAEVARKKAAAARAAAEKCDIVTLDRQISHFKEAKRKAESDLSDARRKLAATECEKEQASTVAQSAAALEQKAAKAWSYYRKATEKGEADAMERENCLRNQLEQLEQETPRVESL